MYPGNVLFGKTFYLKCISIIVRFATKNFEPSEFSADCTDTYLIF